MTGLMASQKLDVRSTTSVGVSPNASSFQPSLRTDNPSGQCGATYATVAEELAAFYARMVDAEYAEHLEAIKADMREQYEYRKGELDRWRVRTIRAMCEGLDG